MIKDPTCPTCDAEIPVSKEEDGESTCCPYCGTTLKLRLQGETWEAEEDY
ncbi:MAG: hypothetical protein Q8R92_09475 [Deltaproteobacteria bacterium]|nr:hypothetical protein [Deltaproteobacteria bacterium]